MAAVVSNAAAAERALLVECAQDTFEASPRELAPPLDPRLTADWELLGHLVARDCVFRRGPAGLGDDACYGFVARSRADPRRLAAAVRGTADMVEWAEDAEFPLTRHPEAGLVERGFWGVYASMRYVRVGGAALEPTTAVASEVGPGDALVVLGHSLGAALATYLAFDLAPLLPGGRLEATLLASPQPGDGGFSAAFELRMAGRYSLINRIVDVVPHLPPGLEYWHLRGASWLWPKDERARIKFGPFCAHHVTSYRAVLGGRPLAPGEVGPLDVDNVACIKELLGAVLSDAAPASSPPSTPAGGPPPATPAA